MRALTKMSMLLVKKPFPKSSHSWVRSFPNVPSPPPLTRQNPTLWTWGALTVQRSFPLSLQENRDCWHPKSMRVSSRNSRVPSLLHRQGKAGQVVQKGTGEQTYQEACPPQESWWRLQVRHPEKVRRQRACDFTFSLLALMSWANTLALQ